MNSWPGGFRHAMHQYEHETWNAKHSLGTRQLCCQCEAETDRCEEDEIYTDEGVGPLCVDCWHQTDEYKQGDS
jgi:hypothetical protein